MRSSSSPRAVSIRIGELCGVVAGAEPPAELDAGQAGQHPVENEQIGHALAQP